VQFEEMIGIVIVAIERLRRFDNRSDIDLNFVAGFLTKIDFVVTTVTRVVDHPRSSLSGSVRRRGLTPCEPEKERKANATSGHTHLS
jgi:hypothetical protein